MRRTSPLLAPLIALALATAPPAIAGNDDAFLIGGQAALTAGAVTAMADDGNSLWYNPAGVARATADTVDVSGNAFVLRVYSPRGLVRGPDGQGVDDDVVEILSAPTSLTYVRPLGDDLSAAYGVFVAAADDFTIRADLDVPTGDGRTTAWRLHAESDARIHHAGGGLAWRIDDRLDLGAALFGVYASGGRHSQLSGAIVDTDGLARTSVAEAVTTSVTAVGLEARVGLTWTPDPRWRFGVSLSTPTLIVYSDVRLEGHAHALGIAQPGQGASAPIEAEESRWGADALTPARLRLGGAWRFDGGRGWIGLDVDVKHPLTNDQLGVDRAFLVNARLGAFAPLSESLAIGGGVFTDLSPDPSPAEFADAQIDFFGASLGLRMSNRHALAPGEAADDLTFSTTLALRYAFGIGRVGGLRVTRLTGGADDAVATDEITAMTAHDLSLHVGSGFYF